MGKAWSWEIFRHAFMFFPRLTAKITFMLKSQLSQTRKTYREISFMCMYIYYIHICCISIYLYKQYISVIFRNYIHLLHQLLTCKSTSISPSASFFMQPTLPWECLRVYPWNVSTKELRNEGSPWWPPVTLCRRFAEPNVPLGTRDFAGCLGMMIMDLVKF